MECGTDMNKFKIGDKVNILSDVDSVFLEYKTYNGVVEAIDGDSYHIILKRLNGGMFLATRSEDKIKAGWIVENEYAV